MLIFLLAMVCTAVAGRTIYVDDDQPADFNTIQAAIDDANADDTIIVRDGIYTGYGNRDIDFGGKAITVKSENGPENCVIDCNGTESDRHRGFFLHSGENADSAIIGFTITNGYALEHVVNDLMNPFWLSRASIGGAIYCWNSSPTISNCTIIGNQAIGGNPYHDGGGGIACYGYNFGPTPNPPSNPTITNCTFSGNSASNGGGIACWWNSYPIITNCTFSSNLTNKGGGIGLWRTWWGSATITNCILWGDSPEEIYVYESTPVIIYSNVQGGWSGPGNINTDPCFADPCNSDYHLKSQAGRWTSASSVEPDANEGRWTKDDVTSPCIDAGDPTSPIGLEPFPNGGRVNMGAYGGTPEASKSYFGQQPCEIIIAGDINGDCKVNFLDFRIMALHWLRDENQ